MTDNSEKRYHVAIEPISAVLRVHKPGQRPGTDSYEFAATAVYSDSGKTVELKGVQASGTPFVAMRAAVWRQFWLAGVDTCKWERRGPDGNKRIVYVDLFTGRLKH